MSKDIVVKKGSYINSNGEKKHNYVKIGVLNEGENGLYLLLFPHINIAGLLDVGQKNVLANVYEKREAQAQNEPKEDVPTVSVDAPPEEKEDDVPF